MRWLSVFLGILIIFSLLSTPAHAAATVTFDSQGTWIVNGQRWFMYGTNRIPRLQGHHHLEESDWQRAVDYYHINIIDGVSSRTNSLAAQHNLYLIAELPWIKNPDTWDSAADKQKIRDEISLSRMLFFAACDECAVGQIEGFTWLYQNYPNVPAHTNILGIGVSYLSTQLKDYLNSAKVAVISSRPAGGGVEAITHGMVSLRNELPHLKSAYILFSKMEDLNPKLEGNIFKAIVGGINGVEFWEPEQPWIATSDTFVGSNWGEVIARVGGYIKEITPGLVAPNRQYKTGYMMSRGEDNRWYVVATPIGNNLTVTGLPNNTQFEKLFYNPGVVTTNAQGTLTDNSAGKIKIYRQKTASNPSPSPSPSLSPSPSPTNTRGDLNNDGRVNWNDVQLFKQGYGTTYNIFHYNSIVRNYDN